MNRHRALSATELAAVEAGFCGDVDTARSLLDHPEGPTRARALSALIRLDAATVEDLHRALADPEPHVRRRAAYLVTRVDPDVLAQFDETALSPLLPDPDDTVTEVATFAAGELPDASDALVARLAALVTDHSDSLCREGAVAALGSLGHPAGLPAVLAACSDKATVRRRAVLALAAFDDPDAEAMLTRLCDDRDLQVRQAAEDLRAISDGSDH